MSIKEATQGAIKERTKEKLREPKLYNVIMHNDDFTTMEFVVSVLIEVFNKTEEAANVIMLAVHKSGRGIVGKYTYDIATTKAKVAMYMAREQGFPFKITVEEA